MMNFLRYCTMLIACMSAGCLLAMEQQPENPFQELNDDPQCPLQFVRYDDNKHETYLRTILTKKMFIIMGVDLAYACPTWRALCCHGPDIMSGNIRNCQFTIDSVMHRVKRNHTGMSAAKRHRYMIFIKRSDTSIGFINWLSDSQTHKMRLNDLVVDCDWRSRGIGMLALYAVMRWEKLQGTQMFVSRKICFDGRTKKFFQSMNFEVRDFETSKKSKGRSFRILDLQNKDLEPLSQKLQDKSLIGKNKRLTTMKTQNPAPTLPTTRASASTSTAHNNSHAQLARMLDMTGKILGIGGAFMSLACLTRSAHPFLQQRSRAAYAMTAFGGLCYGASRWMRS